MSKSKANTKGATKNVAKSATKSNGVSLTEIRRKMKRGEVTMLADRTEFSPSYVSKVLNGTRNNPTILKAASKLVARRKG